MNDVTQIVDSLESHMIESIYQTKKLLNYEIIDKTANCIALAKKIHIFGVGTSLKVAENFYFKLFRIALNVDVHRSFSEQWIEAMNASNKDCAIIISASGETGDMLKIAEQLLKNGVPIITLTENKDSKLLHY